MISSIYTFATGLSISSSSSIYFAALLHMHHCSSESCSPKHGLSVLLLWPSITRLLARPRDLIYYALLHRIISLYPCTPTVYCHLNPQSMLFHPARQIPIPPTPTPILPTLTPLRQWIMGLGAFATAWWRQTRHFGHLRQDPSKGTTYSSLVFDNRGMGRSSKPTSRYSTSEMAKDVVELLDSLGWTGERELNIVGASMGGMIAQELALLPGMAWRINSLLLVSTAPRLVNEVGFFANLRNRINLFIPREVDIQLADTKARLFAPEFLELPDQDVGMLGLKEGEGWPTNGDRFSAGELRKRQDTEGFTKKGFVLQAVAAGWHNVSDERLRLLAKSAGRQRICVVHGTVDGMISFTHAGLLKKGLGEGIEYKVFEGKGHMLPWEGMDEFNALVEKMVEKGRGMP